MIKFETWVESRLDEFAPANPANPMGQTPSVPGQQATNGPNVQQIGNKAGEEHLAGDAYLDAVLNKLEGDRALRGLPKTMLSRFVDALRQLPQDSRTPSTVETLRGVFFDIINYISSGNDAANNRRAATAYEAPTASEPEASPATASGASPSIHAR